VLAQKGGKKVMRDYKSEIAYVLSGKNFRVSDYNDTLKKLLELLPEEKKEQLLRVVLSIKEYKSPRPYSVINNELGDEHDVFIDEAEMIMQMYGYGFSRFDFLKEFLNGLTEDQKDTFRMFLIELEVNDRY